MKIFKRLTTGALALVMLVGFLPAAASAKSSKLIALTFDDGPSYYTERLLDGLKERGVHVSFFMTGQNAKRYPELVKRAYNEGHQICSHTYSHALLTGLSDAEIKDTLKKTDSALNKAIGYDLKYSLRPPYGGYSDRVLAAVGRPCYYWSVDTRDWESLNADKAYRQFISAAKNGSIVLMHDLYSTTITAAFNAVDKLLKDGYEFVTLNELMVRRGNPPANGKIYFSAYPGSYGTDETLSKPVISYKDSTKGKRVYITGDARAKIYYTTDGKKPTPANSKLYKSNFAADDGTVVKAVCVYDWNGFKTGVTTKTIKYTQAGTPAISASNGRIKISGMPKGTTYYYTTDGTVPTKRSTKYSGEFQAVPGTVYTARGYTPGYNDGGWSWVTYSASGRMFTDMTPGSWYYTDSDKAVGLGLIDITGTQFGAYLSVSRAQAVSMLYRLAGSPDVGGLNIGFTDVPEKCSYINAITWAENTGVTKGCGNGRFETARSVTRQELCAMLARFMDLRGAKLPEADDALDGFADAPDVDPVLKDSVAGMAALGVIRGYGDGRICPKNAVNRAEAATMLLRAKDLLDGK